MPTWLTILLAVASAVALLGAWFARVTDTQTKHLRELWSASLAAGLATHESNCRARAAFTDIPEPRQWTESGRLVAAPPKEPTP